MARHVRRALVLAAVLLSLLLTAVPASADQGPGNHCGTTNKVCPLNITWE